MCTCPVKDLLGYTARSNYQWLPQQVRITAETSANSTRYPYKKF